MEKVITYLHALPARDKKMFTGIMLFCAILLATLPFMSHELFWGHDLLFHLTRIQSIADGLAQGQFPVYLHDGFVYGYGYASGVCYPDLFLYFPAILVVAGLHVKRAFFVFMLVENIFCALCAYFCFKRMFASRTIGLILSIMWVLAIYRLVDMVLRTCVGEAWSLTFLPLIAYGVWGLCFAEDAIDSKLGWIALGCGMAAIVHSHVLSVLLVLIVGLPVAIAVAIVAVRSRKTSLGNVIAGFAKAIALCLVLSFAFAVPFLDYYFSEPLAVHDPDIHTRSHSVEPFQLFTFFWSFTGGSEFVSRGVVGEMPYAFGWALAIAFPAMWTALLLRSVREKMPHRIVALVVVLLVACTLFAWVTTATFPWRNSADGGPIGRIIGTLAAVQFPWRFIGPVSFLLLLSLGIVFKYTKQLGRCIAAICVCLAFVEGGWAVSSYEANTEMLSDYYWSLFESKDTLLQMSGEYIPLEAVEAGYFQNKYNDVENQVVHEDPFAGQPQEQGGAKVKSWQHNVVTSAAVEYTCSSSPGSLIVPLLSYSEWQIVAAPEGCSLSSKDGLICVDVPAQSSGTVQLQYVVPLSWRIAGIISLLCLVLLVGFGIATFTKRRVQ